MQEQAEEDQEVTLVEKKVKDARQVSNGSHSPSELISDDGGGAAHSRGNSSFSSRSQPAAVRGNNLGVRTAPSMNELNPAAITPPSSTHSAFAWALMRQQEAMRDLEEISLAHHDRMALQLNLQRRRNQAAQDMFNAFFGSF